MLSHDSIVFIADEAKAVLSILDKQAGHAPILESDWQILFQDERLCQLK